MDEQYLKKMRFFNGLTVNSYNQIIENSRQLDLKTYNIITAASVLLPLFLGLMYYLSQATVSRSMLFPYVIISVGFGTIMFLVAVIKGCWTYKTFSYKALDPYVFLKRHLDENLEHIVAVATATLGDMTDQNWKLVTRKAASFEDTVRILTLGAVAFGLGFFLLLVALMFN